MNQGRTVFSQLLGFLPDREFRRCVARYGGDARPRGFSCWDQYLAMAFAQLTYRDGLRDIEACLRSLGGKLYHMGFHGRVSRSTLADANDAHDWRIYAEFAQVLIRIARPLYASDPIGVDLDQSLYALDSTTIDLCLSLFPWARFRKHKAAVKMHTLLDLHGNIPTFISITDGKVHDVNVLDEILPEAGAFYVMDRGYVDFRRLFIFTLSAAFFVVRTKSNVLLQRRYSHRGQGHRRWRVQLPFQTGGAWPTDAKEVDHKLRWSAPLRRTYGARPAEFVLCAAFRGPFQARIGGFGAEMGNPGVEIATTEGLGRLERGRRETATGVDGTNPIPGVGG